MQHWEIILDDALAQVYELDTATLKQNRAGCMTAKQQQGLRIARQVQLKRYLLTNSVLMLVFLALVFVPANHALGILLRVLQVCVFAGMIVKISQSYIYYRQSSQDIDEGKVRMFPGRVDKVIWHGIRILYCERGVFYNLPDAEWDAFDHFRRYRVYTTLRTRTIVGAHPVHRDEPLPEAWSSRLDSY